LIIFSKHRNENFTINPLPNWLSDHDAQVLVLNQNSQGYDEIPLKILKINMAFIVSLLIYVCNKVLPSGMFPVSHIFSEKSRFLKM
jgi:hypothetical protein